MDFFDRVQAETLRMKAKFGATCEPRECGDADAHEFNAQDFKLCLLDSGIGPTHAEYCKQIYLATDPGGPMDWSAVEFGEEVQAIYDNWLEYD